MKIKIFNFTILAMSFLLLAGCRVSFSDDAQTEINNANRLSNKGKYVEALTLYRDLLNRYPDSDIINYNAGIIYYRKKEFLKAIPFFTKALATEDGVIEQNALFSIGNCYYRLSEMNEKTDLPNSIILCKNALKYYEHGIKCDS